MNGFFIRNAAANLFKGMEKGATIGLTTIYETNRYSRYFIKETKPEELNSKRYYTLKKYNKIIKT